MRIEPFTPEELASFREHTISDFAAEKSRAEGVSLEAARQAAEEAWDRASPEEDDDHVLGRLVVDGEPVGILWFCVRPEWGKPCVWLYDIEIAEERRGRGLGRQAMALLESEARRRGVETIGLHVFGHNERARALYEKLGFRPTSIVMRKDLS